MEYLDFRSDTVTHPTPAMREAMAKAPVGDDVYGDDPTVLELEQLSAELLHKEAALFVPSGTFANQLAVQVHCQAGDEVLLSEQSHIFQNEAGAAAVWSGVQLRCIDAPAGYMPNIGQRIRLGRDIHHPKTKLLCLENAFSSGQVLSLQQMAQMVEIVKTAKVAQPIKIHLDGARIFNASTSLGCEPYEIAQFADTIMFCISKGLCAPVGSLLVGSREDIECARFQRKRMGGGLRQAGILAAAGLIGLKEMRKRLGEDHQRAKYLADLLEQEVPGTQIERERLDINMVFAQIPEIDSEIIAQLAREKIFLGNPYAEKLRFITHYWTPYEAIDRMVGRLRSLILEKQDKS